MSASKIGSITSFEGLCTTRSPIVGVPSGRSPPPRLWGPPPPALRDHPPPYRFWLVRPLSKLFSDAVQPLFQPRRLDVFEALPVHSRCTAVAFGQRPAVGQYVFAIDLVVEQVKAVVRLLLGLAVQLSLHHPDLFWC